MKTHTIRIVETRTLEVQVEAKDEVAAHDEVSENYHSAHIKLTNSNSTLNVDFEIVIPDAQQT